MGRHNVFYSEFRNLDWVESLILIYTGLLWSMNIDENWLRKFKEKLLYVYIISSLQNTPFK